MAVLASMAVYAGPIVERAGDARAATRPLTTAFTDDVYFDGSAEQSIWVQKTVATGARVVLLDVGWSGVAPTVRLSGFDPTNPGDRGYSWSSVDYAVRALSSSGLSVALLLSGAPSWAEGPGRPANADPGTWRPNATAFGQFALAAARRYSGSYPDPLHPGVKLPRVRFWQAWAEPNLSVKLTPQWVFSSHGFQPASPVIYRGLLNAFYAGVKQVHRDNVVITGGTAPFGDSPGGQRMSPATFVREMLCLHGEQLRPERCPNPAHLDVLAHHPYEVGSPFTKALNVDDVSAPDLGKLTRPVNKAVRLGLALPRQRKRLWVTEFSYDSNPPNPQAISIATQARWLEESFYVFWRQGVDTVVWYLIRDQAPIPDYASAYESGVYYRDGTPKPSLQAFQFPFVVEPGHGGSIAWGKSPAAGLVQIQIRKGAAWTTLRQLRVKAGGVFYVRLRQAAAGSFRAVVGPQASLVWTGP